MQLTPYQVKELFRWVRAEKGDLEYVPLTEEQKEVVKQTLVKFKKAYTDKGMKVPGMESIDG